jgi:hypothetical protein
MYIHAYIHTYVYVWVHRFHVGKYRLVLNLPILVPMSLLYPDFYRIAIASSFHAAFLPSFLPHTTLSFLLSLPLSLSPTHPASCPSPPCLLFTFRGGWGVD